MTMLQKILGQDKNAADEVENTESGEDVTVLSAGNPPMKFPLRGMNVGNVFKQLRTALNIDPEAVVVLDGEVVQKDYVLKGGETIEFARESGAKG